MVVVLGNGVVPDMCAFFLRRLTVKLFRMMFLLGFHFPYVAIHGPYAKRKFGRALCEIV